MSGEIGGVESVLSYDHKTKRKTVAMKLLCHIVVESMSGYLDIMRMKQTL